MAKVSQLTTAFCVLAHNAFFVFVDMLCQPLLIGECFFAITAIAVVAFSVGQRLGAEKFVGLDIYIFGAAVHVLVPFSQVDG